VLAQLAGLKIELENSKTEWPARLLVVLHGDAKLGEDESTTIQRLVKARVGITSHKSFIK